MLLSFFVMDESFRLQTPHLPSSAARLNHLLFEVMAVAVPQVAYSFVTKSCPALHTFARAGHRAGTRGETKSQMPRGSCVHEPAGIEGECLGHPVLLSWLRTSDGLAPLPVWPYGVPPVIMRPCRSSKVREGLLCGRCCQALLPIFFSPVFSGYCLTSCRATLRLPLARSSPFTHAFIPIPIQKQINTG